MIERDVLGAQRNGTPVESRIEYQRERLPVARDLTALEPLPVVALRGACVEALLGAALRCVASGFTAVIGISEAVGYLP